MKPDSYYKNLGVMFELFAESRKSTTLSLLSLIVGLFAVVFISAAKADILLYIFIVITALSNYGLNYILKYLCDPNVVKSFIDLRNYKDSEIVSNYSSLNRSTFIEKFTILVHVLEAFAIIFVGGMLYVGLIWLVMRVYEENMLHKYNNQMKTMWIDYDRNLHQPTAD